MIRLAAFLTLLAFPALSQQAAQDAALQLLSAQDQLEAASGARDRITALTQTVQAYEAGLAALRAGQREIALQEVALAADLAARREELAQLLGVLSSISSTPQPVLGAHPQGPVNTARAGMLVADLTPGLEAAVTALRSLLAETKQIRLAQDVAAQTLVDGLQGAQTARSALGQAVSERTDLPQRFEDDPVQTALLLASAETLAAFAAQVATGRPDQETTLTAQGNLPLPVKGQVLPDDDSGRDGIRISAAPRALVTTPVPATILFQGSLLDYGTVVILEPTTDVLFVIAGLAEVFGQAGQVLPAGAAIGLLGDGTGTVDGILTENEDIGTVQSAQPLYLEVREGQSPVNPDAWFALE
jgi:septal ring factor EnvC (AmiA/AmiB activator)